MHCTWELSPYTTYNPATQSNTKGKIAFVLKSHIKVRYFWRSIPNWIAIKSMPIRLICKICKGLKAWTSWESWQLIDPRVLAEGGVLSPANEPLLPCHTQVGCHQTKSDDATTLLPSTQQPSNTPLANNLNEQSYSVALERPGRTYRKPREPRNWWRAVSEHFCASVLSKL